jgi:hypothetical protein
MMSRSWDRAVNIKSEPDCMAVSVLNRAQQLVDSLIDEAIAGNVEALRQMDTRSRRSSI